jgi:hypothetical protein
MCLGLPIALLLSPAKKVWRKDHSRVIIHWQPSWGAEFGAVWKQLTSRRILLLLPAFFISYFYNGYNSTFLTTYLTVRSRAFSSFFTNFSGIISSFLIAALLDHQSMPIALRAKIAFTSIVTILIGTWIWAAVLLSQFRSAPDEPVFDWFKGGFGKAYALVFFWAFGGQAFQQFLYWLVGQYATDLSSLSHVTGILRGFEALGQTVALAIQTAPSANGFASIGLNFGMTVLCIAPTWVVLSELEGGAEVQQMAEVEEVAVGKRNSEGEVERRGEGSD